MNRMNLKSALALTALVACVSACTKKDAAAPTPEATPAVESTTTTTMPGTPEAAPSATEATPGTNQ